MGAEQIEDIYPLSPVQQGMLFHSFLAPKSGIYHVQICYSLRGKLDVPMFARSWQYMLKRHSILRTAFFTEDLEEPLQVVKSQVNLTLNHNDWRGLSSGEQTEQLKRYLELDRLRGFEVSESPLMRLALFRVADDFYQFIWSYHHVLLDGWSKSVILKEVFTCYEALRQGQDLHLQQARPFRDYIVWLKQQPKDSEETFWRTLLKDFTTPTRVGADTFYERLSLEEEWGGELQMQLSAGETERLKTFARQHQLTPNTVVQGAWALLLSRYSSESDVVFGVTYSTRPPEMAGVESMVGPFINTLPGRVKLFTAESLQAFLKKLQQQQVEVSQYNHSSLVQVQGWSELPRGSSLFDSIFVFENYPEDTFRSQDGCLEIWREDSFQRTNYPLTVVVVPGLKLSLTIKFDSARFDHATIKRMLGHFQTLLGGIITNPETPISELPLLTAAEQHQLVVEWNNKDTDYPRDHTIDQLFEAQVERTPNAVAVVFEGNQLTYEELNCRANQLAHYLRALGVAAEVPVGVCMERSLEMMVALLGTLKSGGAYVPLDPAYPRERLGFMLEDTQAPVLLTQRRLVAHLPQHGTKAVYLDKDWDQIASHLMDAPIERAAADNLAYVIYTSGSTGTPKGVCCHHQGVINLLSDFENRQAIRPGDSCSWFTSISFDVSVYEIFSALLYGGTLYIVPEETRADRDHFIAWLTEHQIQNAYVPPFMVAKLADKSKQPLSGLALRRLLVGVEPIPEPLLATISKNLPGLRIINGYGPTEATICATLYNVPASLAPKRNTPIGRAVQNMQIYLLDPYGQLVPLGVPGEIYIGGVGVAHGYLNRPDLTAEHFIANPFNPEAETRLYKTGDMARYLPDGSIEFLGRVDHQVKIRGFRIELGEIESVLGRHPAIRETVVVAREEVLNDKHLVAYVVIGQEQTATSRELRDFLQRKLPAYMVPPAFVKLERLPLDPNGKVDRQRLPAPDKYVPDSQCSFVAPRTPLEEVLAGIWCDVLRIERVGVYDNFFELGGHSLLGTRIISRIRDEFEVELPLLSLFERPTVAECSELIETVGWVSQNPQHMQPTAMSNREEGEL